MAAEREIARTLLGDQNFNLSVGMKPFAHPPKQSKGAPLFTLLGNICFMLITTQVFQIQLSNLIIENEQKLRQAMNIMGLYDSAYWLSWLVWEVIMTLLVSLFTMIIGLCFRFSFFTRNNFIVVSLAFYLNLLSMTSIAFLASTFISQARSANQATVYVLIGSFSIQLVAKFMKDNQIVKIIKHIVPVIPFAKAIDMLMIAATSNNGMSWKGRNKCPQGEESEPCIFTMVRVQMSDLTSVKQEN